MVRVLVGIRVAVVSLVAVSAVAEKLSLAAPIVVDGTQDSTDTRYGAHLDGGWVHFGVFAPAATGIDLLLYDDSAATTPAHVLPMHQHGGDWRLRVRGTGIGAGLHYMYRAKGSNDVSLNDQFGAMFNEHYPLGDPYAYKTQDVTKSRLFTGTPFVDVSAPIYAGGGKSIVYDHSQDLDPGHVSILRSDLIVYEMHVQDYTALIQGLDAANRGTYVGLAEPGLKTPGGLAAGIDHLAELGVTAVELMPVMEYDQETANAADRLNHWGYMTTNFFAPEDRYASQPGEAIIELKQLVKAFHDRGIAVFLDVVYNHTGEGQPWDENGRLAANYYNVMGLCNTSFFKPTAGDRYYRNDSGTGNDVDFSGPDSTYAKRLATESLELWYKAYGVDGFRFDLARMLADGSNNAADWVDNDPDYPAHLHAEPWDMAGVWYDFMDSGGYDASNNRWSKWLGRYRDNVRHFSKSTLNNRSSFKRLIEGHGEANNGAVASSKPWRSVNLVTAHDGYTLRDCVSFQDDGGSQNCWDSGGDENVRREREKLLMGILLTSQGVPLILQGDEFGRTQASAPTQNEVRDSYRSESTTGDEAVNRIAWIDWRLKDGDNSESPRGPTYGNELFHWTKDLIAIRKKWSHFRREEFARYAASAFNGGADAGGNNDGKFTYSFEGSSDGQPTQLAVVWWGQPGEPDLMVIYNESFQPVTIGNLADWSSGDWKVLARSWFGDAHDTAALDTWQTTAPDAGSAIDVNGRSMAILISDND